MAVDVTSTSCQPAVSPVKGRLDGSGSKQTLACRRGLVDKTDLSALISDAGETSQMPEGYTGVDSAFF
jgi:hypothetical protein